MAVGALVENKNMLLIFKMQLTLDMIGGVVSTMTPCECCNDPDNAPFTPITSIEYLTPFDRLKLSMVSSTSALSGSSGCRNSYLASNGHF